MSGTTEGLQRKIAGAEDLAGVVRSMKALAASSIDQYEKTVRSLNDYCRTVELGLAECLRRTGPIPFAAEDGTPDTAAVGAIVFGSDQGLVGRFNEVLAEFAAHTLSQFPGKPSKIWAVGERIQTLMTDAGPTPVGSLSVPTSIDGITPLVGQILIEVEGARERGDVVTIYLFHNHPKSGAAYEPVSKRLLPLDRVWQNQLATLPWPTKNLTEIMGGETFALRAFIREYLFVLLFQACAESLASENTSRLGAMQRAEKNIQETLEGLTRTFHRIRQESIDEELFDVIAGYEALSAETVEEDRHHRALQEAADEISASSAKT